MAKPPYKVDMMIVASLEQIGDVIMDELGKKKWNMMGARVDWNSDVEPRNPFAHEVPDVVAVAAVRKLIGPEMIGSPEGEMMFAMVESSIGATHMRMVGSANGVRARGMWIVPMMQAVRSRIVSDIPGSVEVELDD